MRKDRCYLVGISLKGGQLEIFSPKGYIYSAASVGCCPTTLRKARAILAKEFDVPYQKAQIYKLVEVK